MKLNWWLTGQALGALVGIVRFWPVGRQIARYHKTWTALPDVTLPPATIIVPARDEERVIESCVRSLLAQDYPDFEVIAVDDGSQDATPQILARLAAQDSRLRVVTLDGELPPGWAGKPHAIQQGYAAARLDSQWLLLTDADTVHQPHALQSSVRYAFKNQADLLSVLPKQELKTFWERVLMPLVALGITVQYPLDEINKPGSKVALANGQFILVRRSVFEKVGGYATNLKNSLIDDRDLAIAVKGAGGRLLLENGEDLLTVRMYTGLASIWRGFSKNAFAGSRQPYLSIPFFIAGMLFFGVLPALQLLVALTRFIASGGKRGGSLAAYSAISVALSAMMRRPFDRALGVSPAYSFTSPLAMAVLIGVLGDSMRRSLTGQGVAWKGRKYAGAARTQQIIR